MQGIIRDFRSILAGCLVATATFGSAQAPARPAPGTLVAPAAVYDKLLGSVEKELVAAVEAMPDDKFNFTPTTGEFKGVLSFSGQVKHIADFNWYFFAGPEMTEEKAKAKSEAIYKLTSKAEIVQALKDSLAEAHSFVDGMTPENAFVMTNLGTRAGMASSGLAHMMDHYGQIVEYLRMNGIVPPASRGGNM